MVRNVLNGGVSYSRTVRMFYMVPRDKQMARVLVGSSQTGRGGMTRQWREVLSNRATLGSANPRGGDCEIGRERLPLLVRQL